MRARGFTLIELLVVLALIGIVLSVASLKLGTDRRADQLQAAALDLAQALQSAQLLASAGNRPVGLRLLPDGYRLEEYHAGAWQAATAIGWQRAVEFGAGVHWQADSLPIASGDAPEVVLSPALDLPPPSLVLTVAGTDLLARVASPLAGRFEVTLPAVPAH